VTRGPEIVSAKPLVIAAVRRRATASTIGRLIQASGVWDQMKARGLRSGGHNVVVYWSTRTERLNSPNGIDVDIGADVDAPFANNDGLYCVETPAGRVLRMVHVGPISRMSETYDSLADYARSNDLDISGAFWEVYGHWTDGESKYEVEINHLIG
jgi:effector-binding domain-containing protein